METLSYKLEVFEGPLDLLLTLIAKNKLNIYDIPIALLLEQYMEQIERMQAENLDVASEFLEMAARLVHIKSVSLLPKREEEEVLRRELTGQLLEYKQCRETAEKLRGMLSFDRLVRPQMCIRDSLQAAPRARGNARRLSLGDGAQAAECAACCRGVFRHRRKAGRVRRVADRFRAAAFVEARARAVSHTVCGQARRFGARRRVSRGSGARQGQAAACGGRRGRLRNQADQRG